MSARCHVVQMRSAYRNRDEARAYASGRGMVAILDRGRAYLAPALTADPAEAKRFERAIDALTFCQLLNAHLAPGQKPWAIALAPGEAS